MVDVDKILALKRRINKISEELGEMQGVADTAADIYALDTAYNRLDEADLALGNLT
jgi:hypothetical protein